MSIALSDRPVALLVVCVVGWHAVVSQKRVGLVTVLIPKDDLFRHKYDDCGRLFTIMFTVIQKDLLYLVNQHVLDKDSLVCHTAITEHVHGTTNTDIRKAKHALEGLKIYDTMTVREKIATLEEAILNVDNAQNCIMKPEDKLYYLHEKFSLDGRISVQSVMATCKAAKATYNEAVKALRFQHVTSCQPWSQRRMSAKRSARTTSKASASTVTSATEITNLPRARDLIRHLRDATRETGSSSMLDGMFTAMKRFANSPKHV